MGAGNADLVQSGGVLSSRLRMLLPTPIAVGLEAATARRGSGRERLQARLDLMDGTLRFIVAVQDAERAWLGLPQPPEVAALVRRLDRATYGLWGQAARALAEQLDVVPDRVLPAVGGGLLDGAELPLLHDGAGALIDLRNEIAHSSALVAASDARVQAWLDASATPFRQLVRGLDVLCGLRLVVGLETHQRLRGGWDCRLTVHQGERPLAFTETLPAPSLRSFLPVLLGERGEVVDLHPWLVCDRQHGDHDLLFLEGWQRERPVYAGCGGVPVAVQETAAAPHVGPLSRPAAWLDERPARAAAVPTEILGRLRPPLEDARRPQVRSLQVIRPLGRGGSGTVWLVEDPERGGARFALKVLHPQLATHRDHTERLRQEYAALQQLRVAGTVRVEEVFLDEEHGPCLLMEWVDGPSLRALIRERAPLPAAEAVRIVRSMLETLSLAHARGILHRDIKPSNVVMDGGRPRIIDFGVARTAEGMTLTATADIVGTIAYAAPEQLAGKPARPAADLYGVGRILEELLLGPDDRRSAALDLPGGLQRALRRALQRSPEARYSSAVEMSLALGKALHDTDGGPLIGPGEKLPGGVPVRQILGEVAPDIYVIASEHVALVVPGASGSARARIHHVPAVVPLEVRQRNGCFQVLHTDDGVPYLQIAPDRPLERARELLAALDAPGSRFRIPAPVRPTPVEVKLDEEALAEELRVAASEATAAPVAPAPGPPPAGGSPEGGVLPALSALAAGASAANATNSAAVRRQASDPSPGTAPGRRRKRRVGRTPQGALFGGLVKVLRSVGQSQVVAVAEVQAQQLHHAGLFLLGLEHALHGFDLSQDNWREAWRYTMGGYLVLCKLHALSAGPVSLAVREVVDVAELERRALRQAQRRGLAPDGHEDLVFLDGVASGILGSIALRLQGFRQPWRADYAHFIGDRAVVRRVPASTGWQAVALGVAGEAVTPQ